jgi:hypothetical protein
VGSIADSFRERIERLKRKDEENQRELEGILSSLRNSIHEMDRILSNVG